LEKRGDDAERHRLALEVGRGAKREGKEDRTVLGAEELPGSQQRLSLSTKASVYQQKDMRGRP